MNFILASASDSRLFLLKKAGFIPEIVVSADIDESSLKNEDVRAYARRMSETKASVVSKFYPDKVILAADTVAVKGSRILHKAIVDDDVRKMLNIFSGGRHKVYTSVSLIIPENNVRTKIVVSVIKFKHLTPLEIEGYVVSKEGIGKAGGYTIQGKANLFIQYLGGSFTSVIGLPLYETGCLLQSAGIKPNWSDID